MTNQYLNVATLTWLDRRQLWATTNRTSSLGVSAVPTHPSMLGGQGSRPSVSHRHFSPALSWFTGVIFAIFSLALVSVLALFALRASASLAFKELTLSSDRALTPSTKGLCQRPISAWPTHSPQPLSPSADFANLVYSLVGSLDAASSYIPTHKAGPMAAHTRWEASPSALPLNGWASRLAAQNNNTPSFRSYLGEWRRLLDESPQSPALYSAQGCTQATRSRPAPLNTKPQASVGGSASVGGAGHSASSGASPYSLYLPASWVF